MTLFQFSSRFFPDNAMRGNVYFAETGTGNITLLSPSGQKAVLASDPRMIRPDGMFIGADRKLYIPVKQPLPAAAGAPADPTPFVSYWVALPDSFAGIPLGGAITGKA